ERSDRRANEVQPRRVLVLRVDLQEGLADSLERHLEIVQHCDGFHHALSGLNFTARLHGGLVASSQREISVGENFVQSRFEVVDRYLFMLFTNCPARAVECEEMRVVRKAIRELHDLVTAKTLERNSELLSTALENLCELVRRHPLHL